MPFQIIRQDITKMDTAAIVNAANTALLPGGGVCGAIFEAAGFEKLERACRKIGHCDTGRAVITRGFNLKAKYIIHTPGPIYDPERSDNAELLYSCYRSCLELAKQKKIGSIAFPLISSGIYGYPPEEALTVAQSAVADFLRDNDMDIYLVVYDKNSFKVSRELFDDVEEYIDQMLVQEQDQSERRRRMNARHEAMADADFASEKPSKRAAPECNAMPAAGAFMSYNSAPAEDLSGGLSLRQFTEMLSNMEKSFSEYLLYLIDKSGMTDVQVYKKANIDRKLFSKIRSNPQYKPKKTTAVALALALEPDMELMRDLVGRAGYSFSRSSKFDIIVEFFVNRKNYNIYELNEVLFAFDQPLVC